MSGMVLLLVLVIPLFFCLTHISCLFSPSLHYTETTSIAEGTQREMDLKKPCLSYLEGP